MFYFIVIVTMSAKNVPALNSLKWKTLRQGREPHILKLVKKSLSNECPQFFRQYFRFNRCNSPYDTPK